MHHLAGSESQAGVSPGWKVAGGLAKVGFLLWTGANQHGGWGRSVLGRVTLNVEPQWRLLS